MKQKRFKKVVVTGWIGVTQQGYLAESMKRLMDDGTWFPIVAQSESGVNSGTIVRRVKVTVELDEPGKESAA